MAAVNRKNGEAEVILPGRQAVRDQVARICASGPFRSSRRCTHLLEYITERALDGQVDALKERSLGVEVFGRDPGYDTGHDPVVRYTAGEVRKRLAQYYQASEHLDELRIDLPPGSYVPRFEVPAPAVVEDAERTLPVSPSYGRKWRLAAWLTVAGLLAVAAWTRQAGRPDALERFWAPVISDRGPVLLSIGVAKVFSYPEPERSQVRAHAESFFRSGKPMPRASEGDVVLPLFDRYVPVGDAFCLARLTALFHQKGKPYRFRRGLATSLSDLRDGSGVLIGAFTNRWTLRMTESLRFSMEHNAEGSYGIIRDRERPGHVEWKVADEWPNPKRWTDYGLVTRMRHPATNHYVIVAAGLNWYATSAAGELLTSAEWLSHALAKAPAGWEEKNLQIVYSTPVVEESAGAPTILTVHVW